VDFFAAGDDLATRANTNKVPDLAASPAQYFRTKSQMNMPAHNDSLAGKHPNSFVDLGIIT
jgi:hypothetical protein